MAIPDELWLLRGPVALHLAILAVLIVGAAFKDEAGRFLRTAGAGLIFLACLVVSLGGLTMPAWQLPVWIVAYPLAMAALLAGYGWLLSHDRTSYICAGGVMTIWVMTAGWRGYLMLRQLIPGLDPMVLSLAVFVVAVLISLGKSGALMRWLVARGWMQAASASPPIPLVEPPPS